MAIYNSTTEHLTVPEVQNTVQPVRSMLQEIKEKASFVSLIVLPVAAGIMSSIGGVVFEYTRRFFEQQKSCNECHIEGYNEGYAEGFRKGYDAGFDSGYSEGSNYQVALIIGAVCVGTAAVMHYAQRRQQNTQIVNAQTNQVTSNSLTLVE